MGLSKTTQQEIEVMALWYFRSGIRSHGPKMAVEMIETAQAIQEKANAIEDIDVQNLINQFARYFEIVGRVEWTVAGLAIKQLKKIVDRSRRTGDDDVVFEEEEG